MKEGDGTALLTARLETEAIRIEPGARTATIEVGLSDDAILEADEAQRIQLSDIAGAEAEDVLALLTIRDDETAPPPESMPGDADGDGVYAELGVADSWGSGVVARGQIVNESGAGIAGWSVTLTTDAQIVNIWKARILSQEGDTDRIGDMGCNARVGEGSTTGWGFQGAGPDALSFSDVMFWEGSAAGLPLRSELGSDQAARSYRSAFMTFTQAFTKSPTNFAWASAAP